MPCRRFGLTWVVELILCLLILGVDVQAQATGEITVTNPNTNIERTTQTNSSGVYSIPALPPGEYSLKASMAAFGTQVRNNITLQVNQDARIDIALQVGNVAEVVEVQGGRAGAGNGEHGNRHRHREPAHC
jgi:hypothetical protein